MVFVKLAFLMRHETTVADRHAFFDFVPYRFGPFSFNLYRELGLLRRDGYVSPRTDRIELNPPLLGEIKSNIRNLPKDTLAEISIIVRRYGNLSGDDLLRDVYSRYPWYAAKSQLTDVLMTESLPAVAPDPAIYTMGYEGYSVDGFFDRVLRGGISAVLDVRHNPQSRSYGFSQRTLKDIGTKLGVEYRHFPELGVPGDKRKTVGNEESRQRLLDDYEQITLGNAPKQVLEVCKVMKEIPSLLVCFESDPSTCHRSRLAIAIARASGLRIIHM
jgi:uncharacterized protein (DUF488 family)